MLTGLEVPESYSPGKRLKPDSSSITSQTNLKLQTPPKITDSSPQNTEGIEVITIPFDDSHSTKAQLQIDVLKLQAVSLKREMYARELSIYEKEQNLTEGELKILKEKFEAMMWENYVTSQNVIIIF